MSVNSFQPHVLVLPEDDADRQLANGFYLEIDRIRQMQILNVAGGWEAVLECFQSEHINAMNRYTDRLMVLLIDFDEKEDRLEVAKKAIPKNLNDRVFVLGVWGEPEDLAKAGLGSFEAVGRKLARDCREETDETWNHNLLRHNAAELGRLRELVLPILFER